MKKSLLVLSAILALSLAFVSCGGGDDPEPIPGGTSDTTPADAPKADAFVLTCEAGYNNYIPLIADVAAASGYTTIHAIAKWEAEGGKQAAIQLMSGDAEAMKQASGTVSLTADYTEVSGYCLAGATYQDWSTGSAVDTPCVDTATKLQFYIQNDSYKPIAGKIYVKKVWLSAPGKDDLVVYEFKAE